MRKLAPEVARQRLEEWGRLQGLKVEASTTPMPEGTRSELLFVFDQDPQGNSDARPFLEEGPLVVHLKLGALVPNLRNQTWEKARAELRERGFEAGPDPANVQRDWLVKGQSQEPGTSVLVPSPVTVQLEAPPIYVRVPDLMGRTWADALATLEAVGLRLSPASVDGQPRSAKIVTQWPPPNDQVPPGAQVQVTFDEVPQPPLYVLVPNLVGQTWEEALATLEKVGLRLSPASVDGQTRSAKVVTQWPPPNGRVPPGAQVQVTIKMPPPPIGVLAAALLAAVAFASGLHAVRSRHRRKWVQSHVRFRPEPASAEARLNPRPGSSSIPTVVLRPRPDPGSQTIQEGRP